MNTPASESELRKFWKDQAPKTPEGSFTIGIAGTFTVDPIIPYLGTMLLQKGFKAPFPIVGPYNQIYQTCLNPANSFEIEPDVITFLWRIEDLCENVFDTETTFEEIDRLLDAFATLRKNFNGTLIVSNPPYPSTPDFDVHDLEQAQTGTMLYETILKHFTDGLQDIGNIHVLNLQGLLINSGFEHAHDIRKWYLYKQPYNETFWVKIGAQTARILAAQKTASKKCVVVDCDGTLWGGIVGEDGLSGLELGTDFPGSAFYDFQKYLKHLRNKGIFLAVASKNNEEDVFEVFDQHDAMALTREDISVFEVHWNSKVESLKNIADTLNIGTDSLVFIDDSPKEISEIQERLPEVTCFLVPEEPADTPHLLRNCGLFDSTNLTEEDKKRADMINVEMKRKAARTEMSEEDFLNSLELETSIFEACPEHFVRITQLINKTNQFNLTTRRRTQEEVEQLATNPDVIVLAMDVTDRFGAYGLVGAAIICKEKDNWSIDTFLMSCRVLGRGAETAFLGSIIEQIKRQGGKTITGTYIPTQKNVLVKDFYKDHDFEEDNKKWVLHVS